MNNFKTIIFIIFISLLTTNVFAQVNPTISVLPANSGVVAVGATLDLQITIGNTGLNDIGAFRLRPIVTVPALVTFLPNAQQTGLPPGWSIVSNTGAQLRFCNGSTIVPASANITIILKVQGVNIGGPTTFQGQLNFGNGTNCTSNAGAPAGNSTSDDGSTSTLTVITASACSITASASAGTISCFGGTTTLTAPIAGASAFGTPEYSLDGINFQAANTFTVDGSASPYTVSVREQGTVCTATTAPVIISVPTAIVASTSTTDNTGGNNGTATVTASGGTGAYSYSWNTTPVQTTATATGLADGTYNVTVTDANGCTTMESATVATVLPVTLLNFTVIAKNCEPVLNWTTENEINSDRFEIERSTSSNSAWKLVGTKLALGNNNSTAKNYSFTDNTVSSAEKVFYRLKMIDKDGTFKYSNIATVLVSCKTAKAFVYPNPVQDDKLFVSLAGNVGSSNATLISTSGQIILRSKMSNGTNSLIISNIADGVYILNVKDANGFDKNIKVYIKH